MSKKEEYPILRTRQLNVGSEFIYYCAWHRIIELWYPVGPDDPITRNQIARIERSEGGKSELAVLQWATRWTTR